MTSPKYKQTRITINIREGASNSVTTLSFTKLRIMRVAQSSANAPKIKGARVISGNMDKVRGIRKSKPK